MLLSSKGLTLRSISVLDRMIEKKQSHKKRAFAFLLAYMC
jgi:hypothetical protein